MNKQLTVWGLVAALLVSSAAALADDRGKRGHNNGHGSKHKQELRRDHKGNRYRAVGCHRIEYLRDGSQRRVAVPLSACR